MNPIVVQTTCGDRDQARRIATKLVERRLAACVQIVGPVSSVYRWQEEVESSDEWLCLIKTTDVAYPQVESSILELHSYDCPEIIATRIEAGGSAYLRWLEEQVDVGGAESPSSD